MNYITVSSKPGDGTVKKITEAFPDAVVINLAQCTLEELYNETHRANRADRTIIMLEFDRSPIDVATLAIKLQGRNG